MSWVGWCSVVWVFAATGTAFLPMRLQFVPGLSLLVAAPVLIAAIGWTYGWGYAVAALAAFVSVFRRPLMYLGRWMVGQPERSEK